MQLIKGIRKLNFPIKYVIIAELVFTSWKYANEYVWFVGIAFLFCYITYYNYKRSEKSLKIHWEGAFLLTCGNLLDEINRVNDKPVNINDYVLLAGVVFWWVASYLGLTEKIRSFFKKVWDTIKRKLKNIIFNIVFVFKRIMYKIKSIKFISFLIAYIPKNGRIKR